MRADRLIAVLMLLQARGRCSARELAEELGVCERTIYRDIDALSLSGVPVYAESGRAGGYALVDDYRTSLTGLTAGEQQALFLLSIPEPLLSLGVSQDLRNALRKLAAALPGRQAERSLGDLHERILIDATAWGIPGEPAPHLEILYQAVLHGRRLKITYQTHPLVRLEREIEPYGLVAKAGAWYLVGGWSGKQTVLALADLLAVAPASGQVQRPENFDLEAFWNRHRQRVEAARRGYRVLVRIAPDLQPYLPARFGSDLREQLETAPEDAAGWKRAELWFASLEAARQQLAGFGASLEVLEPQALRISLADYLRQALRLYA